MIAAALGPASAAAHDVVHRYDPGRAADATVVMPVLDGARFLAESLGSAGRQEDALAEIVVVDDGSTDGSAEIAAELLHRARDRVAAALVVRHRANAGPAAARDTAMRLSRAPAALLLDADNVLYPRCLRRCLDGLEASGAAFVYPILRLVGDRTGLIGALPFDAARLVRANYIDTLTLIRRDAWAAAGGFPDLREGHEDHAFWLALLERGLVGAQVPEILGEYRAHRGNRSSAAAVLMATIDARMAAAFPWTRPDRPETAEQS